MKRRSCEKCGSHQTWIYIHYDDVSVYLSRKIITSHFRAERRRREVSRPLGLALLLDRDGGGDDDEDVKIAKLVL